VVFAIPADTGSTTAIMMARRAAMVKKAAKKVAKKAPAKKKTATRAKAKKK
jgi:hypothetical protein